MVKKIDTEKFNAEAKLSPAAVVDFNATWCGPCRMLAPVLEQLSETYAGKVDFYALDVDENPDLAMEYQVQSIPCVVFLKNGQLASTSIGFKPQQALAAWIDSNLN